MTPNSLAVLTCVFAGITALASCAIFLQVAYLYGRLTQKVEGLEKRTDNLEGAVFHVVTTH